MNVFERADRFQLNHDQVFDEKIGAVFADLMIFVEERDRFLPNESDPVERKLDRQSFFINGFKETGTKFAVNRDGSANNTMRDVAAAQIFSGFPAFLIH